MDGEKCSVKFIKWRIATVYNHLKNMAIAPWVGLSAKTFGAGWLALWGYFGRSCRGQLLCPVFTIALPDNLCPAPGFCSFGAPGR